MSNKDDDIIKEYIEEKTPPIDIKELAEKLGLEVHKVEFVMGAVSGKIEKCDSKSGYCIYVNSKHHPHRQRFTIAHEIAHFVLHRGHIGDGIVDSALYRSDSMTNAQEREANRYAAELLLPTKQLNEKLKKYGVDIPELAKKFKVSELAMYIRL